MDPAPPPRPPRLHLTSFRWWILPGLPCFFHHSFAPVYYCQRKPKSKKNRDSLGTRLYILVFPSPDTSHPEGLPREQRTRKRQSLFKLPCGVFTEIYLLAISLLHYLASWGPWFLWPLPEKVDEGLLVEDFHGMFFTNLPQNQVQNHIILLFSNFGREIW